MEPVEEALVALLVGLVRVPAAQVLLHDLDGSVEEAESHLHLLLNGQTGGVVLHRAILDALANGSVSSCLR